MSSYVCRITLPFSDVNQFIEDWADKADKLLVYEHEADEEVSKTHCHFLIRDCKVKEDRLKQIVNKIVSPPLKGNECWSWKTVIEDKVADYITYMTKGKLTAKYNKGYDQFYIDERKKVWVLPGTPQAKKKQDEITELYDSFVKKFNVNSHEYHNGYQDNISDRILSLCRTHTMSHIYHKTGKLPFPGTYKQTAGTLFLRVIEEQRPDYFEQALQTLKNLWY